MFSLADKVFIGKSIVSVEDALMGVHKEYNEARQYLSPADLQGMREEAAELERKLSYFYDVFCPSVGLTNLEVEEMKEYYKNITLKEYYELQRKETLSEKQLFGV